MSNEQGDKGFRFDLQDRLIEYAVLITRVADGLPSTRAGKHTAGQLVRCGTSPAPNYGEAQAAESRKDFIHKLKVCLKELRESMVWLEYVQRLELGDRMLVARGIRETDELTAIVFSSIQTAERNDRTHS
ncbi:MAG: four helix bundle protein [Gemmatimonadetes bacterium]|nr:four helix bundle protein [Gemmatimonadota bacterium]NIO32430.1 four helix bundle protein [Gemmatimonadota bacterium]